MVNDPGWLTWFGIAACVSQSATFSGLNLAFFGLSRLQLEVEATTGSKTAARVLRFRQDSNFLLTTILWGNVGANVLLTMLSESALAGIGAFLFSTFAITIIGEIAPQAYFSRNALKMAARLAPIIRFYQILLYPIAKPSAMVLDTWLGREGLEFFREHSLRQMIRKHIEAEESDIDRLEGIGALNFLALDDLLVGELGEPADPESILSLPFPDGKVAFPPISDTPTDPFVQRIHKSKKKWIILTDPEGEPRLVMNANHFLRDALLEPGRSRPLSHCHRPIVVRKPDVLLGTVLSRLKVQPETNEDHVIDDDLVLYWREPKRIITGADLLGRLLQGIVTREDSGTGNRTS